MNFLDSAPCSGLVIMSAIISPVGHHSIHAVQPVSHKEEPYVDMFGSLGAGGFAFILK